MIWWLEVVGLVWLVVDCVGLMFVRNVPHDEDDGE